MTIPKRTKRYPPTVHWDNGGAICGTVSKWGTCLTQDPHLVDCSQCWWNPKFPRPGEPHE